MRPASRPPREAQFYLEGTRLMAVAFNPDGTFGSNAPVLLFESPYRKLEQPPSYDVAPDGRFVMIKPNDAPFDSADRDRPELESACGTPGAE
jgi:hypothetical protein